MARFTEQLYEEVIARLGRVSVAARQAVESALAGRHRSIRRGLSVEFAGHRPYLAGDDPRHIDWHVWARHERLDVRLYEEETRLRCLLVVDASGSMGYGAAGRTKLDQARTLAAALAYLLVRAGDAVAVAVADGDTAVAEPPGATMGHLLRLYDRLDAARPSGRQELAPLLARLAPGLGRRGLVIVLSDGFEEPTALVDGLRQLRHRRQDVRLWTVHHRDELSFPLSGSCAFTGLEAEPLLRLDADRIRGLYLDAFTAHRRQIAAGCHAAGIPIGEVTADEDAALALVRLLDGAAGLPDAQAVAAGGAR
jgi:uncharacterized protein (DUF58 family)